MTTKEQSLEGLIERVKAASGPDRELDAAIAELVGEAPGEGWALIKQDNPGVFNMDAGRWIKGSVIRTPKPYTASIDAAVALAERVLPGWQVNVSAFGNIAEASLGGRGVYPWVKAPAPALAVVLATLTALPRLQLGIR